MISSQEPLDTENLAPTILKNKEQRTKNKEIARIVSADIFLLDKSRATCSCHCRAANFCSAKNRAYFSIQNFLGVFLGFGSAPAGSLARFWVLGALPRVCWRVFVLRERSRGFPGAFSGFGSIPAALLARFWVLGALPRLCWRVFGLRERSRAFPGAILGIGSAPKTSLWHYPRVTRKSYKPTLGG